MGNSMAWKKHFEGTNAVVTGGASGIGLEIAKLLLKAGARTIVLIDVNQESLESSKELLMTLGATEDRVKLLQADLSQLDNVEAVVDSAMGLFAGKLGLWMNNAGIADVSSFLEVDKNKAELLAAINFLAPQRYARAVLDFLKAHPDRAPACLDLAVTASLAAYMAGPGMSHYCASKAGIRQFYKAMRREEEMVGLAPGHFKVHISCLEPGFTKTALVDGDSFDKLSGPTGFAYTPADVALVFVKGMAKNKFDLMMTRRDRIVAWLDFSYPNIITREMRKQGFEKNFTDKAKGV